MANMRGVKISNEYAREFEHLYADTPKAVFAAVAFAFAERIHGQSFGVAGFVNEWRTLHQNGIVPQAPPKLATDPEDPSV